MNTRNRWLMISVGLGIMLNPLNSSMISVAIARLQDVYRLDYTAVSWVIFSFYIASSVAQPVMGKASDLFGRRIIFLTGLTVAFAASLAAPLSPGFGWLIVSRVIQSVGTSMMVAVGMAIVRVHVTERQASALSVLAIFLSGAAAIGPFVGGTLIQWWDWKAIFLVNIPVAAGSFLLAWRSIPKDRPEHTGLRGTGIRQQLNWLDVPGILLFAAGLTSLLIGVLSAKSAGGLSAGHLVLAGIGLLLLTAFVWHELRAASPFIPLRTFARYPAMTRVNVEYILVNLLYYSLFFGLPSYLQQVRGISEFHTGLLMLSLGLCSLISSPLAGRWIDKSGPRPALLVSALLMAFGSLLLAIQTVHSPLLEISAVLAVFGISNGLNSVGMQAALFQSTPKAIIGVASGVFNTSRYFGTILSSLLISMVMGNSFHAGGLRILAVVLTAVSLSLVVMNRSARDRLNQ